MRGTDTLTNNTIGDLGEGSNMLLIAAVSLWCWAGSLLWRVKRARDYGNYCIFATSIAGGLCSPIGGELTELAMMAALSRPIEKQALGPSDSPESRRRVSMSGLMGSAYFDGT
jgi:hypothetical protein